MNTAALAELEKLLLDAQARLAPFTGKANDFHVTTFAVPPGKHIDDAHHRHPHSRWPAVVQDSDGVGRGPAPFDGSRLQRLAACATTVTVTSEDVDPIVYKLLAATAAFIGSILMVKTTAPLCAAWKRFLAQRPVPAPVEVRAAVGLHHGDQNDYCG